MGPTDAVPEDADLLRGLEDLFPATTGTDETPAFEDVPAISPSARLPVVEEPIPLPPLPEVVCEEPDLPEESPTVEPGPELPDLAFGPAEALPQPDLDWNEASERPTTHDPGIGFPDHELALEPPALDGSVVASYVDVPPLEEWTAPPAAVTIRAEETRGLLAESPRPVEEQGDLDLDLPPAEGWEGGLALDEPTFDGLATLEEPTVPAGPLEAYLVFALADAEYAVPLENLLEIADCRQVTPLPHVPAWLQGVGPVRGDVTSVVDLAAFLGLAPPRADRGGRLLVVHGKQADLTIGLVVDGVREILRVAAGSAVIDAAAETTFFRGTIAHAGRTLRLLDLEALLLSPALRQFESNFV
ncbi:MAG TPA: chemotaxis protein CheW [Gemmataceae bacterium]|nr:chemotaxis protein CheW [Gemmataceae bacterium]